MDEFIKPLSRKSFAPPSANVDVEKRRASALGRYAPGCVCACCAESRGGCVVGSIRIILHHHDAFGSGHLLRARLGGEVVFFSLWQAKG